MLDESTEAVLNDVLAAIEAQAPGTPNGSAFAEDPRVQHALLAPDLRFVKSSIDITTRGRIESSVAGPRASPTRRSPRSWHPCPTTFGPTWS